MIYSDISQNGKGLFTNAPIRKGTCIAEVMGEIVQVFDPEYRYYIDIDELNAMDPAEPYRYINHSCSPNCSFVLEDQPDDENGHRHPTVTLEALRKIEAGEELRTDYGWPAEGAIPCSCGSRKCRGWIVNEAERALVEE